MSGFKNQYPNLPGMLVEFKDGGLQLKIEAELPQTKSILILGSAVDGPVMEPVAVDPKTAAALFGTAVSTNGIPNGATLVPAFEEAWIGGCRDVRLMRISGREAEVTMKGAEVSDSVQEIHEQELGLSKGNDETTLTVENTPVVPGSVLVKANGASITGGVIVDEATGEILVEENRCDAGAALTVEYSYEEKTPESTEVLTVVDNAGTLELTSMYNVDEISSITRNGGADTIAADQYTITDKVIAFVPGAVDMNGTPVAVAADDIFDVVYVGFTGSMIQAEENGDENGQWKADTSDQVFPIDFNPVAGSVHLYANDSEVLDAVSFTVDGAAKTVALKKDYFAKGQIIKVSFAHNVDQTYSPELKLVSVFGGSVYNGTSVEVVNVLDSNEEIIGKNIIITKPESKKAQVSEQPMEFSSLVYPNLRLLVNAIDSALLNNIVKSETLYESMLTADLLTMPKKFMAGGEDGLNLSDQEIMEALSGVRDVDNLIIAEGAYQLLEDYNVDNVVVTGVAADIKLSGKFQNFAYDLAMFCAFLSYRTSTTHGFIGMKPLKESGLKKVQDHSKHLVAFGNNWFMRDASGNPLKNDDGGNVDIGNFISIVAGPGPTVSIPSLGNVTSDGVMLYAAMNTTLKPQSAPTNKRLPGARGLKFRYSNAQLNDITGNRLVTFKTKDDGNVYVVDAMTAAQAGSDYARITTTKVVQECMNEVRDVCDPFIGEPNSIEQRNAMSALIEKRLLRLKEAGVIRDYEFQVVSTPQMQLLGEAKIELTLVPPQELRKITAIVSLSPAL